MCFAMRANHDMPRSRTARRYAARAIALLCLAWTSELNGLFHECG